LIDDTLFLAYSCLQNTVHTGTTRDVTSHWKFTNTGDDTEVTPTGWPEVVLDRFRAEPKLMCLLLRDQADPGYPSFPVISWLSEHRRWTEGGPLAWRELGSGLLRKRMPLACGLPSNPTRVFEVPEIV